MNAIIRTTTAAGAALCLVLGISQATAAAAELESTTRHTEVTYSCEHDFAFWGNNKQDVSLSPEMISATYPEIVKPGETFTITLQPGEWSTEEQLGRIRYDIALPTTGTIQKVELADQGSNVQGTNAEISVIRVNHKGEETPDGRFARISAGNLTIDNGPKADNGNNAATGLTAEKGAHFRLPGVMITMTAPETSGTTITTGLRNAGGGDKVSTLSLIEVRPGSWWGFNNDGINCTADAAGAELGNTVVGPVDSAVTFIKTDPIELFYDNPHLISNDLSVKVNHPDGSAISHGKVRFTVGDQSEEVEVVDGRARITDIQLPVPEGREPAVYEATATYLGVDGIYRPSTASETVPVIVAPKALDEVQGTISLNAVPDYDDLLISDVTNIPVILTATVGSDDGSALPDGLTVNFRIDDINLGSVRINNGTASFLAFVTNEAHRHTVSATVNDHTTDSVHFTGATADTQVDIVPVAQGDITLNLEPKQASLGDTVTLRAQYTAFGGTPEGAEVIFRSNGVRIGTATTDGDGIATLTHQIRQSGDITFTAFSPERIAGDNRHYSSAESDGRTLTVDGPETRTSQTTLTRTVPVEGSKLTAGDEAEFTATVDTGNDTISGTVSFYADDVLLGTADLDPASKTAAFRHVFSSPGDVTVHALFGGGEVQTDGITTATYTPSQSEPLTFTVEARNVVVPGPGAPGDPTLPGGSSAGESGSFLQKLFGFLGLASFTDTLSKILAAIQSFFAGLGFGKA
ncbi:Ig-like domain-containing protein [Corynebacterium sp. CCM 9204]|uniref:Ig-like domain-containing protein n=1 Tax=Corynebacterium sp. CCM 9204 TaxID=3057616 RepID=UPI00352401D9